MSKKGKYIGPITAVAVALAVALGLYDNRSADPPQDARGHAARRRHRAGLADLDAARAGQARRGAEH